MPVAAFVREAALREADRVIVYPRRLARAAWLRGRATARFGTDKIMRLTRGA